MKTYDLLQKIGNTPLIELKSFSPSSKIRIFAKLEGSNPGGSVKDRIAKYMINDAISNGLLSKSKTIIEATSGNTGIGLAMFSALLGYNFLAVMPENTSLERRKILKQFGADILLTDGNKGTNHSLKVALKMVSDHPNEFIMLNQFENNSNVRAHYETTAEEILNELPSITHFVTGIGTGGTIIGVGKKLKEHDDRIQVIAIEPKEKSRIQGLRNMSEYTPSIFNKALIDNTMMIEDDEKAFDFARKLPKQEGVSVGISSGASLWGAINIANSIKEGNIVTIFPDRADRYISTDLFR